jgi:DNA polymerase-1
MSMTKNKPTLLLIDGHSLAFRAFYALSPDAFKTPDGQHTNAVHGFISMMLNILQNEKPTHLAVAFDLSRHSFRTEEYPEYKGTRGESPPEFNGQTELLRDALAAMNILTLTRENYEADDVIASLADQGAAAGYRVLIVSGDRVNAQCKAALARATKGDQISIFDIKTKIMGTTANIVPKDAAPVIYEIQ